MKGLPQVYRAPAESHFEGPAVATYRVRLAAALGASGIDPAAVAWEQRQGYAGRIVVAVVDGQLAMVPECAIVTAAREGITSVIVLGTARLLCERLTAARLTRVGR